LTVMAWGASADPMNYQFQVTATSGPLAGTVAPGTFSFDSSVIPGGGGFVFLTGLLTQLSFTWNGIAYNETTANTGGLFFNASGDLVSFCFGNNAQAGICTVVNGIITGLDQFYVTSDSFAYAVGGVNGIFGGQVSFDRVASVPEPGSALLVLVALALLGVHRHRGWKRNNVA
jgi:MYXO-CTERM domain-containing protein